MNPHIWINIIKLVLAIQLGLAGAVWGQSGDPEKATSLYQQVNQLYQQGQYSEAIPLAKELLAITEKTLGPEHPNVATSLNNLALLYKATGSYAQAGPLFKRALAIREKALGPKHPDVASSLNNLAGLYKAMGSYVLAEPLYKRALAINEETLGSEHPEVAAGLNNLAELYRVMGSYAKAEQLHKRALSIKEKVLGPDHPDVALSLDNLAGLYKAIGSYAQAEPLYERALSIRKKVLGPDHPDVAQSLNNLATLYVTMGSFARAEPLLKRAQATWEKILGPEHPDMATSLNNLAELYVSMGLYAQAEPLHKRALAIREKVLGPEHTDVALSLNNLAGLYVSMRSYIQAELLFKRALVIWEKALGPEHPNIAGILNNLAELYRITGSYTQAEPLYKRSLAILERVIGKEHPYVAISLNNLALLYKAKGLYTEAEPLYKRSLSIREKGLGPDHPEVAQSLSNLAVLFAALGRHSDALAHFQNLQSIDLKVIDQVLGFTSEEQSHLFLATRQARLESALSLISCSLMQDPTARRMACDWWLRRKGMLLEARKQFQQALIYSDDPEAVKTFQELSRVRSQLSQFLFSGPGKETPEAYKKRIAELEAEKERLEAELSRLSQAFARQQKKRRADAAQVAQALPKGTVLVDFARIRHFNFKAKGKEAQWLPAHYLAFVLHAGNGAEVSLIDLGEAEPIDQAVADFKKALADTTDLKGSGASAAGHRLYDLIFAKLKPELGRSKIFISPDGQLNLIPFEVLQSPDGRWLIEDYTFNYLASGRDLVGFGQTTAQAGDPVLLGDPDFDLVETARDQALTRLGLSKEKPEQMAQRSAEMRALHFGRLPGTRKEVETLEKLLGRAKVLTDRLALEEALTALKTSPRILHLATHGFFLNDVQWQALADSRGFMAAGPPQPPKANIENPLVRSGLALAGANQALKSGDLSQSDGLFTAEKVLGLRLRDTELVVLSACQTGTGEVKNGEGVYGLRRAFTQAGAQSIVMSMWSVPDLETTELMVQFYKNLQAGTMNRCQALRQAALSQMQVVKERYGHTNPLFWGAFVFLGQP